jgi:hypothetical protein
MSIFIIATVDLKKKDLFAALKAMGFLFLLARLELFSGATVCFVVSSAGGNQVKCIAMRDHFKKEIIWAVLPILIALILYVIVGWLI